jgi:putative copper resistance protein D
VGPEGPDGKESIERGAKIFLSMQCTQCHGPEGHGNGPSSPTLVDDRGYRIRPPDFANKAAIKCGDDPRRLYTTLIAGLEGVPMPSYGETLTPGDAWDLVHYVLSLRGK